jgi:Nuclease-related domain/AAA domain
MAKLWPRTLPVSIKEDRRRRAEVRVYEKLANILDDSFTVFYSSPWLGTDHLGNEKDGECDFMIAHPDLGYLALEVKGGGISFDPRERQWWTTDANGFRFKIKDPVEQARSAKHQLLKKLKALPGRRDRWVHNSHGVIFPDAAAAPGDLGADKPPQLLCCSQEFAHGFRNWIDSRIQGNRARTGSNGLGKDGVAAFERILAQPFNLGFRISGAMEDAKEQLGVLEPSQFHVLEAIAEIKRIEAKGGAGTGKTIVAIEEARRAAKSGRRTLLTCHSQPLANELRRRTGVLPNLTVGSLHAICLETLKEAGIPAPPRAEWNHQFFDVSLPELFLDALALRPDLRWEHVVIDEGQDIFETWWIAIDAAIGDQGVLRVFSDTNQRVYSRRRVPAADLQIVPIRLTRNLRNTKAIHVAASMHYEGPEIIAEGPDGLPVKWIETDSEEAMIAAAYSEVRRLVYQEEVATGDIAVLLPDAAWVERFQVATSRSHLEFANCDDLETERIIVDTVRRFKGLERPAIVLVAGTGDLSNPELAYVGLSRPRFYLSVIAHPKETKWLREGSESTA